MDDTSQAAGGFIPPALPSPSPSHASTSSTTSNLPHPRSHPLKAGSAKEDAARRYVESRLLSVARRYTKKFQPEEDNVNPEVKGYESMIQVAKDLGDVIDVLWISGTPSLQVPYLLNISGSVNQYLPSFPPAPKATFGLLRKLDHAFASLLSGEDSFTGELLPGFTGGRKALSKTDMVRCKALVEATRVLVVDLMMSGEAEDEEEEVDVDRTTTESDVEMDGNYGVDDSDDGDGFGMDIAKVFEQTIVQLGELLKNEEGL